MCNERDGVDEFMEMMEKRQRWEDILKQDDDDDDDLNFFLEGSMGLPQGMVRHRL